MGIKTYWPAELLDAPAPSDHEAERVVIGSMLVRPGWCAGALDLPVETFHEYRNRLTWEVVLNLVARGEPIDVGAVGLELARRNRLDVVGMSYLLGLQWEGQPGYVEHFARRVLAAAARREIVATACSVLQQANGDADPSAIREAGAQLVELSDCVEAGMMPKRRLTIEGRVAE